MKNSKHWNRLRLFLFYTVLGVNSMAWAQSIELIPLKHRTAAELVPVLRPMLAPGEALTASGNNLIVRAQPSTVRALKKMLAGLDMPAVNLIITVRNANDSHIDEGGVSAAGQVRIGDNGKIVVGRPGDSDLTVRAHRRTSDRRKASSYQVRVIDGHRAFIQTGQSRPYRQGEVTRTPHGGVSVYQGVGFQEANSGFYVIPRVTGDRVILEINPHEASFARGTRGVINSRSAQTTVSAKLGEWMTVGGVHQDQRTSGSGTVYRTNRTGGSTGTIQVKVEKAN